MSRFDNYGQTAPSQKMLKRDKPSYGRSAHDLTRAVTGQANQGEINIVDTIRVEPGDTVYLNNYQTYINSRGLTARKPFTGFRVYTHALLVYDYMVWEGAKNHVTKGKNRNLNYEKPYFYTQYTRKKAKIGDDAAIDCVINWATPNSLLDQIGVPIEYWKKTSTPTDASNKYTWVPVVDNTGSGISSSYKVNNHYSGKICALELLAYQKACRDIYFNKQLLSKNLNIYPDDEIDARLPQNCTDPVTNLARTYNTLAEVGAWNDYDTVDGNIYSPNNSSYSSSTFLFAKHYRLKKGDYFTTALPWKDLIKGNVPVINLADLSPATGFDQAIPVKIDGGPAYAGHETFLEKEVLKAHTGHETATSGLDELYVRAEDIAEKLKMKAAVTMNDLRALSILTQLEERITLTDGSYNDFIEQTYGYKPHRDSYNTIYIGGTYQDITFNTITASTESTDQKLGDQVGRGISAGSANLGTVNADDFGTILILQSIVPETWRSQGIERHLTELSPDKIEFPQMNGLAPQAILNKELFISGTSSVDDDVFGYTERNEHRRSRRNKVGGLNAVRGMSEYDSTMIIKEDYNSTPTLSHEFLTLSPANTDSTIWQVPTEPEFEYYVNCGVTAVTHVPSDSFPAVTI